MPEPTATILVIEDDRQIRRVVQGYLEQAGYRVLTSAEGPYASMYGRIGSAWQVDGKTLTYRATVPANTTATLYLPAAPGSVREGGKPIGTEPAVTVVRQEGGKAVFLLKSGSYAFSSRRE